MIEPTDAEIWQMWMPMVRRMGVADPVEFARAVLAKWGRTPAPVGVEPVASKSHGAWDGIEDVLDMPDGTDLYTADQVLAMGRVPLTHAQAKALVSRYGNDPLHLVYQVEVAHDIKGGQHGTE